MSSNNKKMQKERINEKIIKKFKAPKKLKDVAEKTGVSATYVSLLFNNKRKFNPNNKIHIKIMQEIERI